MARPLARRPAQSLLNGDVSQRLGNPQDEVLRAGAEADFWAPDTEAGADVIVCSPPPVASPGLFVHSIGQPGQRPDLPSVGVAAELEVDSGLLGLLEVVGLMVEKMISIPSKRATEPRKKRSTKKNTVRIKKKKKSRVRRGTRGRIFFAALRKDSAGKGSPWLRA